MIGICSLTCYPEVFCKKGIVRNFAKIHRKTPCARVSFLNKGTILRNF